MKKALIEPATGRIAAVEQDSFPVAAPLYWLDCEDTVVPDKYEVAQGKVVPKKIEEVSERLSEAQKLLDLLKEKGILQADDTL